MPIDNQPLPGMKPGSDQGQSTVVTPPVPLKNPKKEKMKLQTPSKKLKDIIDLQPTIKEEDKPKSKSKHSVMAFGRMNPPHSGHQAVVDKVADVAKKVGAKRGRVVVSHSQDKKKNPLDQKSRMGYIKKMNPANKVRGSSKDNPNFLSYAKKLHKKGTTDLHVVTGSDRAKEFKKTLDKYNNHPDHYSFKSINVHSAGDKRDPKAKGTTGASGTKQREYASKGDYKSFSKNLPKSLQKDGESMYKKMREWNEGDWDDLAVEIEELTEQDLELIVVNDIEFEELINERVMNLMQRRRAALKMRRLKFRIARARKIKRKRMATLDMLTRRARRQARNFIRKRIAGKQGEKYVDLSPSQKMAIDKRMIKKMPFINKMAKRLLPKVRQAELVRLRAARAKKEGYINSSFESLITELYTDWETDYRDSEWIEDSSDQSSATRSEAQDPRHKRLKDKHKSEKESQKKKHSIESEQLKAQIARQKQAEIRREAVEVSEVVDVMVDALVALDKKAQIANVDLDTLFVEFIDGYENPHGKQTPQQGGFAAVNRMIAEMSAAQKDKAEDIVKGMKKKASYFTKKYGKDAKSVMYATANKMAQEESQPLPEGGWKGWARFNKKQGKDLEKRLSKARKTGKGKAYQFGKFGNIDDPAIGEGMGAAYMPDAEKKKTPAREITSKAVLKQLNRNKNRSTMKGKVRTPNVRYVHDRQRETDLTATHRGKTVINPEKKKKTRGNRKKKKK